MDLRECIAVTVGLSEPRDAALAAERNHLAKTASRLRAPGTRSGRAAAAAVEATLVRPVAVWTGRRDTATLDLGTSEIVNYKIDTHDFADVVPEGNEGSVAAFVRLALDAWPDAPWRESTWAAFALGTRLHGADFTVDGWAQAKAAVRVARARTPQR